MMNAMDRRQILRGTALLGGGRAGVIGRVGSFCNSLNML